MKTILFLVLVAVFAVSMQVVYGQEVGNKTTDNLISQLEAQQVTLQAQQVTLQAQEQALNSLLDYCYQHADRPNPLQDLIDKGLMPSNMTGITCAKVKQMNDNIKQMNDNIQSDLMNVENKLGEARTIQKIQETKSQKEDMIKKCSQHYQLGCPIK